MWMWRKRKRSLCSELDIEPLSPYSAGSTSIIAPNRMLVRLFCAKFPLSYLRVPLYNFNDQFLFANRGLPSCRGRSMAFLPAGSSFSIPRPVPPCMHHELKTFILQRERHSVEALRRFVATDPGIPRGRQPIIWLNIPKKLHENEEKVWTGEGEACPKFYFVDPPLIRGGCGFSYFYLKDKQTFEHLRLSKIKLNIWIKVQ